MKSRIVAILLCGFLGGLGFHKFYLNRNVLGLLYMIFCWTFIPLFLATFDFLVLVLMGDKSFSKKYN